MLIEYDDTYVQQAASKKINILKERIKQMEEKPQVYDFSIYPLIFNPLNLLYSNLKEVEDIYGALIIGGTRFTKVKLTHKEALLIFGE